MSIDFKHKPDEPEADFRERVYDVTQRLGPAAEGRVFTGVAVGTTLTPVAHGLPQAPRAVYAMPNSDARVWEPQAADSVRVYLQASAATTCKVLVIP